MAASNRLTVRTSKDILTRRAYFDENGKCHLSAITYKILSNSYLVKEDPKTAWLSEARKAEGAIFSIKGDSLTCFYIEEKYAMYLQELPERN